MTIKEQFTDFINKVQLKKVAAGALIGTMLMGGGFCLAHEYKDFHKDHDNAAYIQTQAAEKNITLIDEAKVKNITSKAISVKESDIDFYKLQLKNYQGKISTEFKPVYKVKCFANGVKYSLKIDAVSGELIKECDNYHFHHREDGHYEEDRHQQDHQSQQNQ